MYSSSDDEVSLHSHEAPLVAGITLADAEDVSANSLLGCIADWSGVKQMTQEEINQDVVDDKCDIGFWSQPPHDQTFIAMNLEMEAIDEFHRQKCEWFDRVVRRG